MTERLWNAIAPIAKWWVFLILLVLFFVGRSRFGDFPTKTFDVRGFYKPSQVEGILCEFGDQLGRFLHQQSTLDLVFPIIYSLTFAVGIVWLGGKTAPRWLVALPFATAFFDYCENISEIVMIRRYEAHQPVPMTFAWIASIATPIKIVLLLASFVALIVLAAIRLYRYSTAVPSSTFFR
jgi:hypothetical protein